MLTEHFSEELMFVFQIACKSQSTVLLTGNTGTGKSFLAKVIHAQSSRKNHPFVVVNLATLHEGLLESELFGHERGSFTGADQRRVGRLEHAQGGTVFLDEVGELSLRLQARLLEFLQSRSISPVGSNRDIRLDVRIIAATHRNLEESVRKGEFREDLFHRLRVISIPLKTLQERYHELDALIHNTLRELSSELGRSIFRLSSRVADIFEAYDWPGNMRELRNVLEYAIMASEGGEITERDLPLWLLQVRNVSECDQLGYEVGPGGASQKSRPNGVPPSPVLGVAQVPLTLDFYGTLERFEKEYIQRALSRNGGRITRTARQIGLNKATLLRRIHAYGL